MDRRNFKEKKLWYLLDNKLRRQKRKKRVNNQWANFIPGNTRNRIERGDFSIKKSLLYLCFTKSPGFIVVS